MLKQAESDAGMRMISDTKNLRTRLLPNSDKAFFQMRHIELKIQVPA